MSKKIVYVLLILILAVAASAKSTDVAYVKIAKNVQVDSATVFVFGTDVDIDIGNDGVDFFNITNRTIDFTNAINRYLLTQPNITINVPIRVYGNGIVKLENLLIKQRIKNATIEGLTTLINLYDYFYDTDELAFSVSQVKGMDIVIRDGVVMLRPDIGFVGKQDVVFTATDGRFFTKSNNFSITVIGKKSEDGSMILDGLRVLPDLTFNAKKNMQLKLNLSEMIWKLEKGSFLKVNKRQWFANFKPSDYAVLTYGNLTLAQKRESLILTGTGFLEIQLPRNREYPITYWGDNESHIDAVTNRLSRSYLVKIDEPKKAVKKIKARDKLILKDSIENINPYGPRVLDADIKLQNSLENDVDTLLEIQENITVQRGQERLRSVAQLSSKKIELMRKSNSKIDADIMLSGKTLKVEGLQTEGIINMPYTEMPLKEFETDKIKLRNAFAMDASYLDFTKANLSIFAAGTAIYKCKEWDFNTQTCYGVWNKILDTVPGRWYSIDIYAEDPAYAQAGVIFYDDMELGNYANASRWVESATSGSETFGLDSSISYQGSYSYSDSPNHNAQNYANSLQTHLTTPRFNLTGFSFVNASWFWQYEIEETGGNCDDAVLIEVSTGSSYSPVNTKKGGNKNIIDGGGNSRQSADGYATCGNQSSWTVEWVNLTNYVNNENVTLRFTFATDAAVVQEGFVIDNVLITGAESTGPTSELFWWDAKWAKRKKFTLDRTKIVGNLTNFPVMISIIDSGLKNAQSTGNDIAFINYFGTQKYSHEIEKFDINYDASNAQLIAWVKMNISNETENIFYMYYANPLATDQSNAENVWDNNFVMVQHLEESSGVGNFLLDSTSKNNDGLPNGTTPTFTSSAKIDGGYSLSGTNKQAIAIPDSSTLQTSSSLTAEGWAYFNSFTTPDHNPVLWKGSQIGWGANYMFRMAVSSGSPTWGVTCGATEGFFAGGTVAASRWYHYSLTYDGTTTRAYLNGTEVANSAACSGIALNVHAGRPVRSGFGYRQTAVEETYLNGIVDELRISNVSRSAAWLRTTYLNQDNPSAFYSMSAEQSEITANFTPSRINITQSTLFKVKLVDITQEVKHANITIGFKNGSKNIYVLENKTDSGSKTSGNLESSLTRFKAENISTTWLNDACNNLNNWNSPQVDFDNNPAGTCHADTCNNPSYLELLNSLNFSDQTNGALTLNYAESGNWEAGDCLQLNYNNGAGWTGNKQIWCNDLPANYPTWYSYSTLLRSPNMTSSFTFRFRCTTQDSTEETYVDNIVLTTWKTDNQANKTPKVYARALDNYYSQISSIKVLVEVTDYLPTASVTRANTKPDLMLEIYDGSNWNYINNFNLPGTYVGAGYSATNNNFSLTTTNSAILNAWASNPKNRNIRIAGRYFDYFATNNIDGVNISEVYVTVNGTLFNDVFQTTITNVLSAGLNNLSTINATDALGNVRERNYSNISFATYGFAKVTIDPRPGGVLNYGEYSNITCIVTDNITGALIENYNVSIFDNSTGYLGRGMTNSTGEFAIERQINTMLNYSCQILVNQTSNPNVYYYRSSDPKQYVSWQIVAKDLDNPDYSKWNISKNDVNQTNGFKANRTDIVKAFAYWKDNIQLKNAYILHNGSKSYVNYSITPFPTSYVNESWGNYTFNFADDNEWKVGKINVSTIYATDGASNLNYTIPSKWFTLYGLLNLTRNITDSSTYYQGERFNYSCRVRDFGNISIVNYSVTFKNATSMQNFGTNLTDSDGWAHREFRIYGLGSHTLICNITDVVGDYYYMTSPLELNTTIDVIEDSINPDLYSYSINPRIVQRNQSILFTANASDDSGVDPTVRVNITNPNGLMTAYVATKSSLYTYTFSDTTLDGIYSYQIEVRDSTGNENKSPKMYFEVIGRRTSISLETNQSNYKAGYSTAFRKGKNVTLNNYTLWTSSDQEALNRNASVSIDSEDAIAYYSESDSDSTRTATAYDEKAYFYGNMEEGTYLVIGTAIMRGTNTGVRQRARLELDGNIISSLSARPDEISTEDYAQEFGSSRLVRLSAGNHRINLSYSTETAGTTVGIRDARVAAIKLPTNNYYFIEENGTKSVTGTTYQNVVSTAFNINNPGYYLIVATSEVLSDSTTQGPKQVIFVNGVNESYSVNVPENIADVENNMHLAVVYLNSGSNNVTLQHAASAAGVTGSSRNVKLTIFRLTDFFYFDVLQKPVYTTTGSSTNVTMGELNFTASSTADYLVFAHATHGGDAGNSDAEHHQVGYNINEVSRGYGEYVFSANLERMTYLSFKNLSLNTGANSVNLTLREGGSSVPDPGVGPLTLLALRMRKGPGFYSDLNQSYVEYTGFGGSNYPKIDHVKISIQFSMYNSSMSNYTKSIAPDMQVRVWDGSNYDYYNYTCGLIAYYGIDGTSNYNCTKIITDKRILQAWNKTTNRRIQVRGIYLDHGDGYVKDTFTWNKVIAEIKTPSITEHFSTWNTNSTLLMQVQRYNTTISAWQLEQTITNTTLEQNASSRYNLSAIFKQISWKPNYNNTMGLYRVYAALLNSSKEVKVAFNTKPLNDTYNFTVRYLKINPIKPLNISYGNSTVVRPKLTVDNTYYTQQSCVYSLDGAANSTMAYTAPNIFAGLTNTLSLGTHTVKFFCNDTEGWTTTEKKIQFVMTDWWPPKVNLSRPLNGTVFELEDIINISANVSDNRSSVDEVWVNITGPSAYYGAYRMSAGTIPRFEYNFTSTGIPGRYDLTIFANDTYSNINKTKKAYFNIKSQANITGIASSIDPVTQDENTTLSCRVQDRFNGTRVENHNVSFYSNRTGLLIGINKTNSTGWAKMNYTSPKIGIESVYCRIGNSSTYTAYLKYKELNITIVQFKANVTKRVSWISDDLYRVLLNLTNYGQARISQRKIIDILPRGFNISSMSTAGTSSSRIYAGIYSGGYTYYWDSGLLMPGQSKEVNYTLGMNMTNSRLAKALVVGVGR